MMATGIDFSFMQKALDLAEQAQGQTSPNPTVGAVIVKDGEAIGEGFHERAGFDHAEVAALKSIGDDDNASAAEKTRGATVYVTLEPCCHTGRTGPCSRALIDAGVSRVVVASLDPSAKVDGKGIAELEEAGIEVEVLEGLIAERARALNEGFRKHAVTGLPFVTFKSAMSIDGKIATASGDSRWISGEESRELVHSLRGHVDAIAVGSDTARLDDPMLTCRLPGAQHQPLRVIFDSSASLSLDSKLVRTTDEAATLVFVTKDADSEKVEQLRAVGVEVEPLTAVDGRVDVREAMEVLGSREPAVLSMLLEGGPTLAASFIEAGLIDKIMTFIAPKIIGGESAKTPVEGRGFNLVDESVRLYRLTHEQVGEDILLTAYTSEEEF